MSTIKLHKQNSRYDYEEVFVDENDIETIKQIRLNNKEINHDVYLEKKYCSRFSIDQIEKIQGHDFIDRDSDPWQKIEDEDFSKFEQEKDRLKSTCISELFEIASKLTGFKKTIFYLWKDAITSGTKFNCSKVARSLSFDESYVRKTLKSLINDFRNHFRKNEILKDYFPNLFKN